MTNQQHPSNRLIREKSPYLLQHAYNPVDWYPWGEEAFVRAFKEDKPMMLSIGYSTCHWCHVMERESFENQEIAAIMNEHFVSVKVDREERPDVDQIYMAAVTAMTGQGGWPLTVFLTPEKKPFYGGTYFPPYARWGSPGFTELLKAIAHSWKTNRTSVVASSVELTAMLQNHFTKSSEEQELSEIQLGQAFNQLKSHFDVTYGGFGQAPKFPMGHTLSFLLRYWKRMGNPEALSMVHQTLTMMAQGGMCDQLGGGFHRYSTDQYWQVPHFEKMLYDQALLARAYLEGYQATAQPFFAHVARQTLDYVLRDLRGSEGGFYCAEDADSVESMDDGRKTRDEGRGTRDDSSIVHRPSSIVKKEGAFYVWTQEEIASSLGEQDTAIVSFYFGIETSGNAANDPHGEFTGKNILSLAHTIEETAQHFQKISIEIKAILDRSMEKLFVFRQKRARPHLDDKVLTDWNGLMISAFAFASQVLGEERYAHAAEQAADFILEKLQDANGRLLHRYRDGQSAIGGTLEDYAFFILGLLDLYEATFEADYLQHAKRLTDAMLDLFWDDTHGGFFLTANDAEELIARPKEIYDGALPSGNSVAVLVLSRMYRLTADHRYQDKIQAMFQAFAGALSKSPSAYPFFWMAFDFHLGPVDEIVFAGPRAEPEFSAMKQVVFKTFNPNKVLVAGGNPEARFSEISQWIPLLHGKEHPQRLTAYVCRGQSCQPPVFDSRELENLFIDLPLASRNDKSPKIVDA